MNKIAGIIRDTLAGLSRREKVFLIGGVVFFVVAVTYFSLVSPALEEVSINRRVAQVKAKELEQMTLLAQEYRQLSDEVGKTQRKVKGDFSLLPYLEDQITRTGMRDKISFMRPKGELEQGDYRISTIELGLSAITLQQAMELISRIEGSQNYMRVKMLKLKTRFSDPNMLDLSLRVSSYNLGGKK